jgi:hypothetical protein
MDKSKGGLLVLVVLVVAVAVAMLYRMSSQRDLPDDEWFDFEQPSN